MTLKTWDDETRECLAHPRPLGDERIALVSDLGYKVVTILNIGMKLQWVHEVRDPANWQTLLSGFTITPLEHWLLCPDDEALQIKNEFEEREKDNVKVG